jgi:hypothetical protein
MNSEDSVFIVGVLTANILFVIYIFIEIKEVYRKLNYMTIDISKLTDGTGQESIENKIAFFKLVLFFNIILFFSGYSLNLTRFIVICSIIIVETLLLFIFFIFNKRLKHRLR